MSRVGLVAIGRNEGDRLARCLASLAGLDVRAIYVDSGSTDGSVEAARASGLEVIVLDDSRPHTAARGRNAGAEALMAAEEPPEFLQFIDGDCAVAPGWIDAALEAMDADPDTALITGWRTEIDPDASVYNQMCEVEWHRPAGEIRACGGDLMVRAEAFEAVDGFDPGLICSEDEDFVLRLRAAGLSARRIPRDMTFHDAEMTRFSQWWRRTLRAGHGFAEVGRRHNDHFVAERRRALLYGLGLPLAMLAGSLWSGWTAILLGLAIYAASWLRTARGLAREGVPGARAYHHAAYYTFAKFPQMLGMMLYHWRRIRGVHPQLIEYK